MTEANTLSISLELPVGSDGDFAVHMREFVQDRGAFSENAWRQLLSVMSSCGA